MNATAAACPFPHGPPPACDETFARLLGARYDAYGVR